MPARPRIRPARALRHRHRRRSPASARSSSRPAAAPGWSASPWRSSRSPRSPSAIDELLDEVMASEADSEPSIPAVAPLDLEDSEPLEQPIEEEFRAGTMTLSWDPDDERVVIEVFPFTEAAVVSPDQVDEDFEEPEPDEVFLVRLPAGAARAFVQARRAGARGRPAELPVLRQPDRPRRPPVRAGQRLPPPRPVSLPAHRPTTGSPRASWSSTAGSCRPPTRPSSARSARTGWSTSRSRGSGRCGTSPTARSPTARSRRTSSPRRSAGTSCRHTWLRDGPHGPGMVQLWQEPDADQEAVTLVAGGRGARGLAARLRRHRRPRPAGLAGPRGQPSRCAGWPSSTSSSTTPTARAATCWRWPTGTGTASTTASPSTSSHKLRTVLWGWLGEPLTDEELAGCAGSATPSAAALRERRCDGPPDRPGDRRASPGAATACWPRGPMPAPRGHWPAIPWPPF